MRIVIVDDNTGNLLMFRQLISDVTGHQPVPFEDPARALGWCAEEEPDLVLVDYMMPGLDGLEFIRRFRDLAGRGDIPIIMVTTEDLKEVRHEALRRGATDFLSKPVDATEFTARISNLLTLRQSQLQLRDRAALLKDEVVQATADIVDREHEVIFRLSRAAEYRDPETGHHIMRMAHFSRLIARGLGLSTEEQDLVFRAAPMHDVGKVGTPDDILLKPGRLTEAEFETMKEHASIGYRILEHSPIHLLQAGAEIALSHHEKFDGSGYPNGLAGADIPQFGRIVAVADVFDALASARPYKKAWTTDAARDLIESEAGAHFDPECVRAFIGVFDDVLDVRRRFLD
jgi:putative two-component system response regulator